MSASAALPALAQAAPAVEQTIRFDVVGGGVLAGLCGALITYLQGRRARRQPPLGEDVARTYASKSDLAALDTKVTNDISALRLSIVENDKKAEDRARGTHARIDTLYREQQKHNKSLGMLIGIMIGKGNTAAASAVREYEEG